MRFWDSSAIVPLVVEEAASRSCRDHLRADRQVVVWCLTRTEVLSGLCRRRREGGLSQEDLARAESRLEKLAVRWDEVDAVLPVREAAERLLRVHALRAADALQLAAALVLVDHRPRRRPFVSLDEGLSAAAAAEGFEVLVPRG
ncbi:MAG: type II toxin-antitoxin system VapC family toxin [Planctomycetes bacterium]|nr:type II toxin-antitoxin system VapC family toxin [Planctomycetota bacterium]